MREIMGEFLGKFLSGNNIHATRTYSGSMGFWENLEVYQMDDAIFEEFDNICNSLTNDQWEAAAGEDAWWRSAEGSNMGSPDTEFSINGEPIIAWRNEYRFMDLVNEFGRLPADERKMYSNATKYADFWCETVYKDLLTYFCDELGASTERNVCALAIDLAKYNGITMAELFAKYGGASKIV